MTSEVGGRFATATTSVSAAGAAMHGSLLRVDPGKVLEAAEVVAKQADALSTALMRSATSLRVDAPSQNEICVAVADAWNSAIVADDGSYLARAQEYLKGLRQLERQLRRAAEHYRLDDEESAAAFNERDVTQA